MQLKELRSKTEQELQALLRENRIKLADLRFKTKMGGLASVRDIRKVRKLIATLLTILKEKIKFK